VLRASRAHQEWIERRAGVPAAELRLLRQLAASGPVRAGEAARAIGLHASTVSNLLRKLRERGWLDEQSPGLDRRARQVGLSDAGRQAARTLEPWSRGFAAEALRHATPVRLATVIDGLQALLAGIPARWRPAATATPGKGVRP
jgi:DNA-binding MarR family transcriptional regulator